MNSPGQQQMKAASLRLNPAELNPDSQRPHWLQSDALCGYFLANYITTKTATRTPGCSRSKRKYSPSTKSM
jgi:hypothetical protein